MNILGRPYVFGNPEQTAYIQKQFKKEDLQNKIANGFNQVLEGVDEYVYEFLSDEELEKTIEDATNKIRYKAGLLYKEDLEFEQNTTGFLEVKWNKRL